MGTIALAKSQAMHTPAPYKPIELELFQTIRPGFGLIRVEYDSVMFREGEVAVFDEQWTANGRSYPEPIFDEGGIYVTEYQRPGGGMSWEMWNDNATKYGARARLDIRRSMVRVARSRWRGCEDKWMIHPLARTSRGAFLCSDGPYDEFLLACQVIGKVVGIYRPN